MTPADALQRLLDGNARFVAGTPLQTPTRAHLLDLTAAQHPFASVLGCSDSRVPPEIVFDQGLGDLFVVRVAGNVVGTEIGTEVLGSLGYALAHLGTPLFLVLGHEECGAVQAALGALRAGPTESGPLAELVAAIGSAIDDVDAHASVGQQLSAAVEANVRRTVRRLSEAPAAHEPLASGRIALVGAVYELATGRVRLVSD